MSLTLSRLVPFILGATLLGGPAQAQPECGPDALGVSRTISIGRSEGVDLGLLTYPHTLDLRDHEVVLTFDDGPALTTPRILDALAKECVRATFFVIGRNAEFTPHMVRREVVEGHSVGHHSYSHPGRTLRLMSYTAAQKDIETGIAAVEKAAYGESGEKPHTAFFRFPGFADSPALLDWLHHRGMTVFGADLWASDWRDMTPEEELRLVLSRLEQTHKGIILFHDSKGSTARMLPEFLRALKQRGFQIVHLVSGSGPTPVVDAGPGWKSLTEDIIAKTLGPHEHREPKRD